MCFLSVILGFENKTKEKRLLMNKTAAVTGKKFTTQRLALMAMFAAILCISAYISVPLPLTGYHVTFLNFVITLIALVFPLEQSLLISIVWLLLGAVGVPVFIGGNAGIGYLMGPLADIPSRLSSLQSLYHCFVEQNITVSVSPLYLWHPLYLSICSVWSGSNS